MAVAPVVLAGQGQQGQTQLDWGSRTPKPVPGPAASLATGTGGLDPAALLKPLGDTWPTYSGDYTGRRYSSLNQINQSNVKNLTLAWVARLSAGSAAGGGAGAGGFGGRGGGGAAAPTIVGGEGTGEFPTGGGAGVKGSILMINNVLYVTAPDNTWAHGCPRRAAALAVLLEDQGRHAHRQPRVGDVARLPLFRDA